METKTKKEMTWEELKAAIQSQKGEFILHAEQEAAGEREKAGTGSGFHPSGKRSSDSVGA